ncbi:MAG TPA: hypothetical protein VE978_21890 [Chitinophagales bacterium]|nr:hypothetical protein [Chitinophagales bacterium]
MKKLSSIAIVVMFAALILSSCKKDYTCHCTVTDVSVDTTISYTGDTIFTDSKKSDAKDRCNAFNGVDTAFGHTFTTSCAIQ